MEHFVILIRFLFFRQIIHQLSLKPSISQQIKKVTPTN